MSTIPTLLLLSLSSIVPQGGSSPDAEGLASVLSRSFGVHELGQGILAGTGPGYSSRFEAGAFRFWPALGAAAPEREELRFELLSIARGGTLVHAADPSVEPRHEGSRVVYPRGPDVLECYEVGPDGVEQSFVFRKRLAGSGDLVVRGRLVSTLPRRVEGAAEGLVFERPGLGGITIGAVTGVDARGRSAAGRLDLVGDVLELTQPGAFVDQAAWPLVLDPLFGPRFNIGSGNMSNADVAYSFFNDTFFVVWENRFSSASAEIVARGVDSQGQLLLGQVLIQPASDCGAPRVAPSSSGRFAIVHELRQAGISKINLAHAFAGGVTSSVIVASDSAGTLLSPDVGGDWTQAVSSDALVVWRASDGSIDGAACSPSVVGPVFDISFPTPSALDFDPRVTSTGGADDVHAVIWLRLDGLGGTSVESRAVDLAGNPLGPTLQVESVAGTERLQRPDVDGAPPLGILAAWERVVDLATPRSVVRARALAFDGTALVATKPAVSVYDDPFRSGGSPSVAWTQGKSWVAYVVDPGGCCDRIEVAGVDPATCMTCETLALPAAAPTTSIAEVTVAAARYDGGGGVLDHALAVWPEVSSVGGSTRLDGQILMRQAGTGSAVDLGGGCGPGGVCTTSASEVVIGNPEVNIRLFAADPGSPLAILNLKAPLPPMVCGPCQIAPYGILFFPPIAGGVASQTLPIPCNPTFVGAFIEAQWTVLLSPGTIGSCSLAPSWAFSNRLRLTIGL